MPGFDPFAFVGDIAKGVGDVAKGVGDIANNAAKIAAGAVDGAIKAMASEGNEGEQKSFEDHHDEPRPIPEPQYRDCEIDAFYVEKRYVAVRQITVGANGDPWRATGITFACRVMASSASKRRTCSLSLWNAFVCATVLYSRTVKPRVKML